MKTYIGVKIVQAELQVKDGKEGYVVSYIEDAKPGEAPYSSWCPKDIFERHNREVTGEGVPFSKALEALKRGEKIARKGWNGKNQFLFLADDIKFTVVPKLTEDNAIFDPSIRVSPAVAIKTTNGVIQVGWLASQTDMLSDDWFIVE
jgi:hypothetical protein